MHIMNYCNSWYGTAHFFNGPFGMIFSFLLWGLVFFVLFKAVGLLSRKITGRPVSGIEKLQKRYADGSIDEETYFKMKKELSS